MDQLAIEFEWTRSEGRIFRRCLRRTREWRRLIFEDVLLAISAATMAIWAGTWVWRSGWDLRPTMMLIVGLASFVLLALIVKRRRFSERTIRWSVSEEWVAIGKNDTAVKWSPTEFSIGGEFPEGFVLFDRTRRAHWIPKPAIGGQKQIDFFRNVFARLAAEDSGAEAYALQTLTALTHHGWRRYTLTTNALILEKLNWRGKATVLQTVKLSRLSPEFFLKETGTYIANWAMALAHAGIPVLLVVVIRFPDMKLPLETLFAAFVAWFLFWFWFGSARDVEAFVMYGNAQDTMKLAARLNLRGDLEKFVLRVSEQTVSRN
jgi:hypothetical protein